MNIHRLAAHGSKMHFPTAILVIDFCLMLKLGDIEVGVEFAVDACQQVQVKRSSYAQFVIVGGQQLRARLHQVSAYQQRISRHKNAPNFGQKLNASGAVEISNRAAQKQNEEMLAGASVRGHFE